MNCKKEWIFLVALFFYLLIQLVFLRTQEVGIPGCSSIPQTKANIFPQTLSRAHQAYLANRGILTYKQNSLTLAKESFFFTGGTTKRGCLKVFFFALHLHAPQRNPIWCLVASTGRKARPIMFLSQQNGLRNKPRCCAGKPGKTAQPNFRAF